MLIDYFRATEQSGDDVRDSMGGRTGEYQMRGRRYGIIRDDRKGEGLGEMDTKGKGGGGGE